MISYKYFHTPSRYEQLTNPNNSDVAKVAETVRKAVTEKDYFLYATVGEKSRLMMSSEIDPQGNQLVNGLYCTLEEMNGAPPLLSREQLAESKIAGMVTRGRYTAPPITLSDRAPDACVMAKLIDALLISESKNGIVVGVSDVKEAEAYLKMLYFVLPTEITANTGFFVSGSAPVSKTLEHISGDGEKTEISIRISLLTNRLSSSQYSNLSVFNTVFDAVSHKDNYTAAPSALGEYVSHLDLRDFNAASRLRAVIQRVYSDGNVNLALLKVILASDDFAFSMSSGGVHASVAAQKLISAYIESAHEIRMGCYDLTVDAVKFLLSAEYMTDEQTALVNRIRIADESIKEVTAEEYVSNRISNLAVIGLEEIESLKAYMNGRREVFAEFLDTAVTLLPSDTARVDAVFKTAVKTLFDKRNAKWLTDEAYYGYLEKLVRLSNINNRYSVVPLPEQHSGENIFDAVSQVADEDGKVSVLAILMLSAYMNGANKGGRRIRIKGLKRAVHKDGIKAGDEMNLVISVYERVEEMSYQISSLPDSDAELDDKYSDFIFDDGAGLGDDWIGDELINNMGIEALVTAVERISNMSSPYEALRAKVNQRLCKASFAKDAIYKQLENRELLGRLKEIYDNICLESPIGDSGELKAFVDSLRNERGVSTKFEKFRTDYTKSLYATFSDKAKKAVAKRCPETSLDSTNPRLKIKMVESVIDVFGIDRKEKMLSKRSHIFLWSFLLSLLSLILIAVPPFVQALVTGPFSFTAFLDRVISFVELWYLALPLAVIALNTVFFLIKRDTGKANKVTACCILLPMLCFVIAFLLFYFIRLDVSFIRNMLGGE